MLGRYQFTLEELIAEKNVRPLQVPAEDDEYELTVSEPSLYLLRRTVLSGFYSQFTDLGEATFRWLLFVTQ